MCGNLDFPGVLQESGSTFTCSILVRCLSSMDPSQCNLFNDLWEQESWTQTFHSRFQTSRVKRTPDSDSVEKQSLLQHNWPPELNRKADMTARFWLLLPLHQKTKKRKLCFPPGNRGQLPACQQHHGTLWFGQIFVGGCAESCCNESRKHKKGRWRMDRRGSPLSLGGGVMGQDRCFWSNVSRLVHSYCFFLHIFDKQKAVRRVFC